MLKVELLHGPATVLGGAAASLRVSNTTTDEAIALRHALQKDVVVAAVNSVTFLAYDGPLEAEIVAHRFGQLPIALCDTDDASSLWNGSAGVNDSSSPPHDIATLEVAVTNSGAELMWVTSHDITCPRGRVRICHYRSDAERRAARDVGFLVCPLLAGQTLRASASVVIGSARTRDARWGAVFVAMKPTDLHDDFVSDEPDDAVAPTEFDFYIETTGAVTALGAWRQALAALSSQLKAVAASATVRPLVHSH
jgi:hypothetical protein